MNIKFLGGANEVGGSSTLVTIEGQRILVDAGIRMNSTPDEQFPDFSQLHSDTPEAVLLTHAHTDHSGALPVLMRDYLPRGVKVYCTAATKAIVQVLLEDNAKRQNKGEQQGGEPPRYTDGDVTAVFNCMEEVSFLQPIQICGGTLTAKWIPAGHILGASMIYLEGDRESILITGDVSDADQSTIPGMVIPDEGCRPDVMVMESTYGNRQHKDRTQEENKLAEGVAEAIKAGGKVLIPAFAVGRSQEVILVLKRAMERKLVPEFSVYVDGLVRKVNGIYSDFSDELSADMRRKIERGEDLFYSNFIKEVRLSDKRERILKGEPCCIVASSGMLNGGISRYYAERLAGDPKNLIATAGYQAEGTPGRRLQDKHVLNLDGKEVSVACRVEEYSLSAHADRNQLTQLVAKVQPGKLFLVHGEGKARYELKQSIETTVPNVHVERPRNGNRRDATKRGGIAAGRCRSHEWIIREVFDFVRKAGLQGPFWVRELAEMWFGTDETSTTKVKLFRWFLSVCRQEFFVPDNQRRGLFHLKPIA